MYFNENDTVILFAVKRFPIGRLAEAVNMGNVIGCTVWIDSRSIDEYGYGELFIACGSDESQIEMSCWLQNTMAVFEVA